MIDAFFEERVCVCGVCVWVGGGDQSTHTLSWICFCYQKIRKMMHLGPREVIVFFFLKFKFGAFFFRRFWTQIGLWHCRVL